MTFKNSEIYSNMAANKQIPVKYVNNDNRPTVAYPSNPNGSPGKPISLSPPSRSACTLSVSSQTAPSA